MDFPTLIQEFKNSGQNFEEAEKTLRSLALSEPDVFITNLLSVITSSQDKSMQMAATNMLTIPIKRNNDEVFNRVDPRNIAEQTRLEMKNILVQMLSFPDDLSRLSSEVLVFYFENDMNLNNMINLELISMIQPENASIITINFLKTIMNLSAYGFFLPDVAYQSLTQIFEYASNVETPDEYKSVLITIFMRIISRMIPITDLNEFLFNIIQWVWMVTPVAPKEGFEFIKYAMSTKYQLVTQIPNFAEQVYSCVNSDKPEIRIGAISLLGVRFFVAMEDKYEPVNFLVDQNLSGVLQLLIDIISSDESEAIVAADTLIATARISLSSIVINSPDEIRENLLSFALEKIGSQRVGERDASVIVFTNLLYASDEKTSAIKPYLPDYIMQAINDSTPRILILGFYLLQSLAALADFVVLDQMVECVVGCINADIEGVSNEVIDCLFQILHKCSDEAKIGSISAVFEHVMEMQDDDDKAEYLRTLTSMVLKLDKTVAVMLLPQALEIAVACLQSETVPTYASSTVGFAAALYSQSEDLAVESYVEFLQIGISLVQADMIADGAAIFTSLLKTTSDPQVTEYAQSLIREKLNSVSNSEELTAMLKLCIASVKTIEDPSLLENILLTAVQFAASPDTDENVKDTVFHLILTAYEKSKDLIYAHLAQIYETIFIIWKYPLNVNARLNTMSRESIPYCNEKSPVIQKLVLGVLYHVDDNILRGQETGRFIIEICEAVHRCVDDPLFALTCIANKVENLRKIVPPDVFEKICSYLPQQ